MSVEILESALLLILLLDILRTNFLINQLLLIVLACLIIPFLIFSLLQFLKLGNFFKVRLSALLLIVVVLYGFWLGQNIARRTSSNPSIHDGAVLTEAATEAILAGANPYAIDYRGAFKSAKDQPLDVVYSHYMYSPMTFLINVPFKLAALGDLRVTLVVFLLASALIGSLMVQNKLLFLIIFLLNPLFVPLTFYGANEVLTLFFIVAALALLKYQKVTWATVMVALATGTKLLALPLVPLYFMYLWLILKEGKGSLATIKKRSADLRAQFDPELPPRSGLRQHQNLSAYPYRFLGWLRHVFDWWQSYLFRKGVVKQVVIFIVINLIVYLPFAIWSLTDLVEDILLFHLSGGSESHVIAGFVGLPQFLVSLGLISATSNFPFYWLQIILAIISLPLFLWMLKKSLTLSTLCLSFVFYFLIIFAFSRIIQTSYLAFLSQILILVSLSKSNPKFSLDI